MDRWSPFLMEVFSTGRLRTGFESIYNWNAIVAKPNRSFHGAWQADSPMHRKRNIVESLQPWTWTMRANVSYLPAKVCLSCSKWSFNLRTFNSLFLLRTWEEPDCILRWSSVSVKIAKFRFPNHRSLSALPFPPSHFSLCLVVQDQDRFLMVSGHSAYPGRLSLYRDWLCNNQTVCKRNSIHLSQTQLSFRRNPKPSAQAWQSSCSDISRAVKFILETETRKQMRCKMHL